MSRWEIIKFENCWYKSIRILVVLKLLFQQFLNLSSSLQDMSGPILGALSNNRWLGGDFFSRHCKRMKNWGTFRLHAPGLEATPFLPVFALIKWKMGRATMRESVWQKNDGRRKARRDWWTCSPARYCQFNPGISTLAWIMDDGWGIIYPKRFFFFFSPWLPFVALIFRLLQQQKPSKNWENWKCGQRTPIVT